MTRPLNEYKKLTSEDLIAQALARTDVTPWHKMTDVQKRAWYAEVEELGIQCEQLLRDLNSGKI